jgi:uncharacterized protein YgbK (DUF1537 family)
MPLQVGYYADDMTGATDALANYAEWGLTTRLVLDPADVSGLAGDADVIGVAGTARSLPTAKMTGEIRPALEAFKDLDTPAVQYKICSTFDSSPAIGSIGLAAELLLDVWGPGPVPVLAAQPNLGRWTVFGTHFAAGPDGTVHRLDRHPTMAIHPVTPAHEADLVNVLVSQTHRIPVRGLHLRDLDCYADLVPDEPMLVVLDALSDTDIEHLGRLLWKGARPGRPVVAIGSGGLSYALASAIGTRTATGSPPPDPRPVLALSGSMSDETRLQTEAAARAGWEIVDLVGAGVEATVTQATVALHGGRSVVVTTAVGAPRFAPGEVGGMLGACASRLAPVPGRLILAGGDTSGTLMHAIGARGLEYVRRVGGTGVLCKLLGPGLDHTQAVLKGGKIGAPDFYERVRLGY